MKMLIVMGGYFPGKKYGGPPVSVNNFCSLLNDNEFYIITHDHDLNENQRFDGIVEGWNQRENCRVTYLNDKEYCKRNFEKIIKALRPDILYLQGIFQSCVLPCLQLAKQYNIKVLLAPRGELCQGALSLKKYKKIPYLLFLRMFGLLKNVHFQSTSLEEKEAIQNILGAKKEYIHMLDNIPSIPTVNFERRKKTSGEARFVFISRIHPKKNLQFAISLFESVKGKAVFDIYGSIEDSEYWDMCRNDIAAIPKNVEINYKGLLSHQQVHKTFSEYDAFVFPTLSENYGHVIAESLIVGTPVIISNQTPWNGVNDAHAGMAISLDNKDLFIQIINTIIELNDEQARSMSDNAKNFINSSLRIDSIRSQYQEVISSM